MLPTKEPNNLYKNHIYRSRSGKKKKKEPYILEYVAKKRTKCQYTNIYRELAHVSLQNNELFLDAGANHEYQKTQNILNFLHLRNGTDPNQKKYQKIMVSSIFNFNHHRTLGFFWASGGRMLARFGWYLTQMGSSIPPIWWDCWVESSYIWHNDVQITSNIIWRKFKILKFLLSCVPSPKYPSFSFPTSLSYKIYPKVIK